MSQTDLTLGALARIVDGEDLPEPVVQVLGHKEITVTKNDQKTLRLLLNDGKYSYSFVMLSTQLGHLVLENAIAPYMVIKVKKYVCNQMANQGKKAIIILDLEVLQRGELVGRTIGNPDPIGSDGKVPTPASTGRRCTRNIADTWQVRKRLSTRSTTRRRATTARVRKLRVKE